MNTRKQTSARVVKLWLDVSLVLGGIFWCFLSLWLLLSPLVMSDSSTSADGVVQVAIGSGSLRPVLSLSGTGSGNARVDSLRIVDGRGELRFKTTTWWLHFVSAVRMLLGTFAVLFVIYLLRNIVVTVTAGRPFTVVNVQRIRLMGLFLLVGGVVVPLVEYLTARIILGQIILEGISVSPPFDLNGGVILGGLLILVLATVFEYGSRLETDQSLTI
ncbi:MAG: hypothetical protein AMS18_09755 [Gemmatimonas sp. SG8_17]|nr:MAG: hypothetical protein AMS18_09755 [Gemmatimonas sp. SG8_17]